MQELRGASYAVLNELLLSNGVLSLDFVRSKFAALPGLLVSLYYTGRERHMVDINSLLEHLLLSTPKSDMIG